MADDEDHGDNRPDDMILDEKVVKMGEELAVIFTKRKNLTADAATIYSNADKLGIPPAALQAAVKMVRIMDKDDRKAYQSGVRRVLKALEPAAADLFPEDIARLEKRRERAKERETKAAAKAATKTAEDIERGDPKRGGAGGADGHAKAKDAKAKKPAGPHSKRDKGNVVGMDGKPATLSDTVASGDALIASTAASLNAAAEQITGAAILDTAGKPKSQSQIAAEKLEAAKLT